MATGSDQFCYDRLFVRGWLYRANNVGEVEPVGVERDITDLVEIRTQGLRPNRLATSAPMIGQIHDDLCEFFRLAHTQFAIKHLMRFKQFKRIVYPEQTSNQSRSFSELFQRHFRKL